MPTATTPKRNDKFEAALQSRTSIGVPRQWWQGVQKACQEAIRARPDNGDWSFVPSFLGKLESSLKAHNPRRSTEVGAWLDANCIHVEGRVCNWRAMLDIILEYGDEFAKGAGSVIAPACSNILIGPGRQEAGD